MSKKSDNKSYNKDNSRKVTFFLENNNDDLLNAVVFLTNKSKVHLLNEATEFFLKKLIAEEEGLKEKIEIILKK